MPGLLYADDLGVCGELEEDLKVMVGQSSEVCVVNAGKNKVIIMNGEGGIRV